MSKSRTQKLVNRKRRIQYRLRDRNWTDQPRPMFAGIEITALMTQRHLVDKASSCPHGRPTTLHLTKAELNRQFKRT